MINRFKNRKSNPEQEDKTPACEMLTTCTFASKYDQIDKIRMRTYQLNYCQGPRMQSCARIRFYNECHAEAPEDLAPTGIFLTHFPEI